MTAMQRRLLSWYAQRGRHTLPWRGTRDPYRILVAEFMLQQTQVDRVVPKYEAFLARFPDIASLAEASVAEVLRAWQGLGYNTRALRLKRIAQVVLDRFESRIPAADSQLRALPGIGPYTAAALRVFAFEEQEVALDINVTRVLRRLLHEPDRRRAERRRLYRSALAMVPVGRAHDWNSALMDLGATICTARVMQCNLCPLRRHCATASGNGAASQGAAIARRRERQPRFETTMRYARGRIIERLRDLHPHERISLFDLHADLRPQLARSQTEIVALVQTLEREGFVEVSDGQVALSSRR